MIQKPPIFVTGIQRSGSTMVAKILKQSGVFTGETSSTMEHKKTNFLLSSLYRQNGWDVKGQYPLPNAEGGVPVLPDNFLKRFENYMYSEGYGHGQDWLVKGHKLLQIWKLWITLYPSAKWIIVRRRPTDVIESCEKTAYMNRYNDTRVLQSIEKETPGEGWLWWIHENERFLNSMIAAGLNYRVIWPERMAQGDFQQIEELHRWLGIEYNEEKVRELIEPMMQHSKQRIQ